MRGILTVGDQTSFDELDGYLAQGLVTSYDQLTAPPGASVAVQPTVLPGATPPKTPSILDSLTSILSSGAQAYGAYATAKAAKKATPMGPAMPPGYNPYTVAPTSAGMDGTTIALLVGGGILVLGVGAIFLFRK